MISPDNPYSASVNTVHAEYQPAPSSSRSYPSRASTPSPTEPSLQTPPFSPGLYASCPTTPTQATYSRSGSAGKGLVGLGVTMAPPSSAPSAGRSSRPFADEPGTSRSQTGSGSGSGSASNSARTSAQDRVAGFSDEDEGLVMRDRGEGSSVGRSGGVETGVTRPKRRLSSLPCLPNPYEALRSAASTPLAETQYRYDSNRAFSGLVGSTSAALSASPAAYQRLSEKMGSTMAGAAGSSGAPRLFGIELKWLSLLTLALQNASLTIIMHYSRVSTSPNKTYSAAAAVLLNEILKGSISSLIALRNIDRSFATPSHPLPEKDGMRSTIATPPRPSLFSMFHPSRLSALRQAVFSPDCYKLAIPAILYVIQNNLQFTAASNLDVATFQVTYQMKILTTAVFSVFMLGKRLSKGKWLALFLLAVGVGIVQIQSTSVGSSHSTPTPSPASGDKVIDAAPHAMSPLKGFLAVAFACITSGAAGVYFEKQLKGSSSTPAGNAQPDLWVRNAQLSFFSLIPAIVPVMFTPVGGAEALGPVGRLMAAFANFNGWAIGTVMTQTFGGLITAVVIRYSDNIMKGFATSLSIIISFLASVALFAYPITFGFVIGCTIVLAATFMYNAPSTAAPPTRKDIAIPPGSPISASAPILGEPEKPSRANSVMSLIGLSKSSSRAPSRAPSGENLKGMSISPTRPLTAYSSAASAPTSSAPASPYLGGASYHHSGSGGKVSPNLTPLPFPRGNVPPPLKTRRSGSGGSTGSDGSGSGSGSSGEMLSVSVSSLPPGGSVGERSSSRQGLKVDVGA